MSIYRQTLPEAFPHAFQVPRETAIWLIGEMTTPFREDGLPFSSFAATADTHSDDYINLWLSEASYKFALGRLASLEPKVEST